MIAVLHEVPGGVDAARSEIDGEIDLNPGPFGPGHKLVRADLVGLGGHPCRVEPPGTLRNRSDAILPSVAGDEVAARIANDADAELAHQVQHIPAETGFIGRRMPRLVDTAVDGPAQMLDEGSVQSRVHLADPEVLVDDDACGLHRRPSPLRS